MAKHEGARSGPRLTWPIFVLALVVAVAVGVGATLLGQEADTLTDPPAEGGSDAPVDPITYVALGDSYTSAPWVPDTDGDDPCLRSAGNYPNYVARASEVIELVDVSCGGATTDDMTGEQQLRGGLWSQAQFDALHEGVDLVTVGIGFNNFDLFELLVYRCYPDVEDGSECHKTSLRGDRLTDVIDAIEVSVEQVVAGVNSRSPDAEVVVVPYPKIFPDEPCRDTLPFGKRDLTYMNSVNEKVSTALAEAAERAGASSVDVFEASRGHDICAEEPWVQGETTDTEAAASFHPLEAQQRAVADLVLNEICEDLISC